MRGGMACGGESYEGVHEIREMEWPAEEKVMRESTKYEKSDDLRRRKL